MRVLELKLNEVLHLELHLFTGRTKVFELRIYINSSNIVQEQSIHFNKSETHKLKDIINNTVVKVIKHEDRAHLISVLNLAISSTVIPKD